MHQTSRDLLPSGQYVVPRMLTIDANAVMVAPPGGNLENVIGQKLSIPQSASVHPAVMGTWWNNKRKNCSMAIAAENALHSSQEDETVYE